MAASDGMLLEREFARLVVVVVAAAAMVEGVELVLVVTVEGVEKLVVKCLLLALSLEVVAKLKSPVLRVNEQALPTSVEFSSGSPKL